MLEVLRQHGAGAGCSRVQRPPVPRPSDRRTAERCPTEVSGPNTTRPIQRPRGVPNADSMQLCWLPPCTTAPKRGAPMIRASSSVDATIAEPSAAAVITSNERENPCCATTWPDVVISRMSRADDSVRNVCSGSTTHGSSARIRLRRPTASSISSRASPRLASRPASATSTRSFCPGAASTEPVLPRRCTNVGICMPAPTVARPSR